MKFVDWGYGKWKFDKTEIEERLKRVLNTIRWLNKKKIYFDAIVVHGTSGTWLAPLLVMKGFDVLMVRKDGEHSHGSVIEGKTTSKHEYKHVLMIDDLICSGSTIKRVRDRLELAETPDSINPKIVGVALHDQPYKPEQTTYGIPIFGWFEGSAPMGPKMEPKKRQSTR